MNELEKTYFTAIMTIELIVYKFVFWLWWLREHILIEQAVIQLANEEYRL